MANLISSVGYSLGKLHSGLLAYLCNLHREGITDPLTMLLESLGVTVPRCPRPIREWNCVDLAIFDGDADCPSVLIEMKVDDHERDEMTKWINGKEEEGTQTELYAKAYPNCEAYLFITLGMGEYYHAPCSERFRWVQLRDFTAAVDQIPGGDPILEDWRMALHNEMDLQQRAWRNDRSRYCDYRSGAWNIYLLGQLKEALSDILLADIDPSCYTCGVRPDTILNFGWSKYPRYLEINYNGRLNLKVALSDVAENDKQAKIRRVANWVQHAYPPGSYNIHEGGRIGNSKTIASFDIGISVKDELLEFSAPKKVVIARLRATLDVFFSA